MSDEIIGEDEVSVSPRGRKANLNPDLIAFLKKIKPGSAAKLSGTFGNVARDERAQVSQVIRKHWRAARTDECRIDYTTDGVPQVRVRQSKPSKP